MHVFSRGVTWIKRSISFGFEEINIVRSIQRLETRGLLRDKDTTWIGGDR